MARYSATQTQFDTQPIVVLQDDAGGREIRIARHGAALLSYKVRAVSGAWRDVAAGYRDADEIASHAGSRFAIMVPFAGRIADARYSFAGRDQDLQPGVTDASRGIRHGFVRDADFAIVELDTDEHRAQVVLATSAIRPQPGYPHAIDLRVTFTLGVAGLMLEAQMRNVGNEPAPCFFGWHPYFSVGDGPVDTWELQIPAQSLIRTGADLIALAGEQAYVAVDDAPAVDFREPRCIGQSIIDQGYTDVEADADGRIRTRLRDPAGGWVLTLWQESGVVHAFTADTISRGVRRAIALEPMECMADAFNRPECAAAIRLEPGMQREFRCGVEVLPA
ncbi:MAG: aldose epimerase [Rhodanobacter sp.]